MPHRDGDPDGSRSWTPGSAPQHTATFSLEEHLDGEDLFEGLDDLFDSEKVARIIAQAVLKIKKVIDQIMPALDQANPIYRQMIQEITDRENADFNQIAAEYITQEAFFLMASSLLALKEGSLSQHMSRGAFALTHYHSLVAVSPASDIDKPGQLNRPVMSYSRMPSRQAGWDGELTTEYRNQPLGSDVRVGERCSIVRKGIETSPLRMVMLIPPTMSEQVFRASTNSIVDGFTSSTQVRRGGGGRPAAVMPFVVPNGREEERQAQRTRLPEPGEDGSGEIVAPQPPSDRLLRALKRIGLLD